MRYNPSVCVLSNLCACRRYGMPGSAFLKLALMGALSATGCGSAQSTRAAETEIAKAEKADSVRPSAGDDKNQKDAATPSKAMVEMEVVRMAERRAGGVILLLREKAGEKRMVPMVIGPNEGNAIFLRLARQKPGRPLTHDLLESVLREYRVRVLRLEIDDLQKGVFLGRLFLKDSKGNVKRLDTRPSDGIALALGADAPIFMSSEIIAANHQSPDQIKIEQPPVCHEPPDKGSGDFL